MRPSDKRNLRKFLLNLWLFLLNLWKLFVKFLNNPYIRGILIGITVALLVRWLITPSTADIMELIRLEAELSLHQPRTAADEHQYGSLFADDACVIDVRPQKFIDGRSAIVRRFRTLPTFLKLQHQLVDDIKLFSDHSAIAKTNTLIAISNGETYQGHEEWMFEKINGKWKIRTFQFDIP